MKRFKVMLFLIVLISLITVISAEELEYETITKMAEDVNCRAVCHSEDPHVIHAETPATCQGCHGETLTDRQPLCIKCHKGTIHNVHIKKVQTEDCSYCHAGLDQIHLDMMSNTLCSHCHKELLAVHGGPVDSCEKCHGIKPNIVAPVKAEANLIVCQNCHKSADVAILHGEAADPNSCYRCHRPGSVNVTSTEIPHFIHIPNVACELCHIDQETGKIMVPECLMCHVVEELHGYEKISLKTASSDPRLDCSVCHPMVAEEAKTPAPTATPEKTAVATPEVEEPGVPGFGAVLAFTSLAIIYLFRRIKN